MYTNIIKSKLKTYCEQNGITDLDKGFQQYINEIFYTNIQDDFEDSVFEKSIVDGQSDKQIDLIQIEDEEIKTIRIMQVKNKKGFESNVVILLRNGLEWIFNKDEEDLRRLKNEKFRNRILEVREIIII